MFFFFLPFQICISSVIIIDTCRVGGGLIINVVIFELWVIQ